MSCVRDLTVEIIGWPAWGKGWGDGMYVRFPTTGRVFFLCGCIFAAKEVEEN